MKRLVKLLENNFFKKLHCITALLLLFVAFLRLNMRDLDIGLLPGKRGDDYVWTKSLFHIYHGFLTFNLDELFWFPRGYGVIYFYFVFILTLPFFLVQNYDFIVLVPRMVSSLFAVLSLAYIYKIGKLYLKPIQAFLICVIIAIMPEFWILGQRFYPQWMSLFFLLVAIYYFIKDNEKLKRNFWFFVILLSLSVSSKLQSAPYFIFIPLYILSLYLKGQIDLKNALKNIILATFLFLLVFIITNPYLLHPIGLKAFINEILFQIKTNKNNHGTGINVTVIDKLSSINTLLMPYFIGITILIFIIYILYKIFSNKDKEIFFHVISIANLIVFLHLLFFVNKNWMEYYLPVIVIFYLILVKFASKLKYSYSIVLLVILFIIQLYNYHGNLISITQNIVNPKESNISKFSKNVNDSILTALKNEENLTESQLLISPYTPLQFQRLNIELLNIHSVWMLFSERHLSVRYDYIIIRKNDTPFRCESPEMKYRKLKCYNSLRLINRLKAGHFGYRLFFENGYVIIFKSIHQNMVR